MHAAAGVFLRDARDARRGRGSYGYGTFRAYEDSEPMEVVK